MNLWVRCTELFHLVALFVLPLTGWNQWQALSQWFLVYSSTTAWKETTRVQCHSLLLLSHQVVSDSLWPHRLSMPGFPVLIFIELVMLFKLLILCSSLLCLQSFPASRSFPMSQLFPSSDQSIGVSASTSVLSMYIQEWFPLSFTVWSHWSPRNSQESSLAPQFEGISSLVLSFLYGPILISIQGYWKSHSFDYTDLCQLGDVFVFYYAG